MWIAKSGAGHDPTQAAEPRQTQFVLRGGAETTGICRFGALAMLGYGAVEWGNGNWFVSYASTALHVSNRTSEIDVCLVYWRYGAQSIRLCLSYCLGVARLPAYCAC